MRPQIDATAQDVIVCHIKHAACRDAALLTWPRNRLDPYGRIGDGQRMFPIRDHNPSENVPYVTYALLVLNIGIFALMWATLQTDQALRQLYCDYALIPTRLDAGDNYLSLLSSTFLHAGLMHLAGNMLFLWIFGDNLEDKMGHLPFLVFYLFCGAGAGYAQYATEPWSQVPVVGASGAIAGVMGGYLVLFPKAKVDVFIFFVVFFRILPIPAWIMLGLWFGLQLFNGVTADTTAGGVAYWAHAGGFVIGVLGTIPLWLRLGGRGFWRRTDGHPDHLEATYGRSRIPVIRKR